ncbi:hypothetical protein [Paracoccus fontiphilus]|uniref:Uncharacterized protein n=1 Tax=Paracoccus fontiphilus TaxID=1815556 RepID=A0ABV7II59_9RHOB|nr:hypothetical protein [Paracoccus fontiphilus]
MPLSQFPTAMPAAVSAVLRVAAALRYIRDSSGDLPFRALDELQDALRASKITTFAALSEGAKAPEAAEAFMSGLGGPVTLAAYEAAAMDIEAKASAWNTYLGGVLQSLPVDAVIGMVTISTDGVDTRHIERRAFMPAAYADPLRASQELADLAAAFEAVGA